MTIVNAPQRVAMALPAGWMYDDDAYRILWGDPAAALPAGIIEAGPEPCPATAAADTWSGYLRGLANLRRPGTHRAKPAARR